MNNKSTGARPAPKKRRKKQTNPQVGGLIVLAVLLILILTVLIVILSRGGNDGAYDLPASAPTAAASPTASPTQTPAPTPSPTPAPSPTPDIADARYAALRPEAREGNLPVFFEIDTKEKIIAITVDDCYQAENLWTIIRLAEEYGAKLTFFPIGEMVDRSAQAEALKYAWQNGMEIENHTYTHNNLYQCTDEELAQEIYSQNLAVSRALGVEYQCHFLRPKGGDARNDQRIHAYISQLGYKGVAHWSESGTRKVSELSKILKPGQIYLFHTTDADVKRLEYFIPYAVSKGYRLVTMNELFGYPANQYSPLVQPTDGRETPALQPYEKVYPTYTKGGHAYGILEMQARLIELGYLAEGADGIFGENTEIAVRLYQKTCGLPETGKADKQTQLSLFSENAIKNPVPLPTIEPAEEIVS